MNIRLALVGNHNKTCAVRTPSSTTETVANRVIIPLTSRAGLAQTGHSVVFCVGQHYATDFEVMDRNNER